MTLSSGSVVTTDPLDKVRRAPLNSLNEGPRFASHPSPRSGGALFGRSTQPPAVSAPLFLGVQSVSYSR